MFRLGRVGEHSTQFVGESWTLKSQATKKRIPQSTQMFANAIFCKMPRLTRGFAAFQKESLYGL